MKNTFSFLQQLKKHNDRNWFEENRNTYDRALEEVKSMYNQVYNELQRIDQLDDSGSRIYRIYNDVRFHPNKPPYKTHFAMSFARLKPDLRGGYYLHMSPGDTFLAAGFWAPAPADLLHIRQQISQDPEPLRELLAQKAFKDYFGQIQGDKVKTSPKGFTQDDPAIDLIRYKQLIVTHSFTDEECLHKDFAKQVAAGFAVIRPFFNYMSDILTTDLNGVPLNE